MQPSARNWSFEAGGRRQEAEGKRQKERGRRKEEEGRSQKKEGARRSIFTNMRCSRSRIETNIETNSERLLFNCL
ncbi:hypothetical protein [Microcoleus sp. S13_C3]|uniref:hypothetical protein n=1 Tax=Microcoleus sp. S13_C3 TaxID=3055409 RepID=UPI002FD29706